ncbi:bifunctional JmjC domain/JmjN domain [Babesia duncani]|uniref:Bifunctional JmjC domain/JmjN domain n=1 Tax=Babesia duncani TaxID=323732 RepID=A0AAD9PLH5_9APIC|nr:bifunctional JmjC domain/JmjN domain [Babesia duncani]
MPLCVDNEAICTPRARRNLSKSSPEESPQSSPFRRSNRAVRKPTLFKITHQKRGDRVLTAAIRRSKVETCRIEIDFTAIPEIPTINATLEEFVDPVTLWNKYSKLGQAYGAIKVIPPQGYKAHLQLDLDTFSFRVRKQQLDLLLTGKGFTHPPETWTAAKLQNADSQMLQQIMNTTNPSLEEVEKKYWNFVVEANSGVEVHYGADLNIYAAENLGSILPVPPNFENDSWNLRNLPKCNGSLLKYIQTTIPGVWYIIPSCHASRMEALLKNYIANESEAFAIYSLRVQIPIDVLLANNITVYRLVQRENEFVFVWPRTFHAGLNAGYNCNEACNIAPPNWVGMGYKSLLNYKFARKTCLPFYSIIMNAVARYVEIGVEGLDYIIEVLLFLLLTEYRNRKQLYSACIQMYINVEDLKALAGVQGFLASIPARDFDAAKFSSAVLNLASENDDEFLTACSDLSNFCMKDCDVCDSPTFSGIFENILQNLQDATCARTATA